MFLKLVKQFALVGFLLLIAFFSLYVHTSIHTDWIPEEYNIYALVYGHFGESSDSDKGVVVKVVDEEEEDKIDILDKLTKYTP